MLVSSAAAAQPTYSNGFETDTSGWFDNDGTINQRASGFVNPGGYASGIDAAAGTHFAGLDRGPCEAQVGGSGPAVNCAGPYTRWGGYNTTFPAGGYTTQVDIYLDTAYANAHPDTYSGNLSELTAPGGSADPNVPGTRFDYTSAINDTSGSFLRDFGFNVSTGYANDNCNGFMVTGQTNVNRINANPNAGGHDPQCIDTSGWYTFKHTFSSKNGFLDVLMQIFPKGSPTAAASWDITGIDPDGTYGCNRYGYFSNQEIWGLPIDNASMTGCGTPLPEPPVVVKPPPVIVLPPEPGTAPPVPAGPPAQAVGNEVVAKMRKKELRSCVIEVRTLGPRRALIARGVAHAPSTGTGRLVVRINVKPKGKTLLSKKFGGVVGNVRALCRSTSGKLHRFTKRMRIVLLVEHRLTPPGSWVPDQPILTGIGFNFMSYLRHRIFATRLIQCEGYTATYPPSPAYPPTLSLNRARRVCSELKRRAGAARARVKLIPHGLTDPIATNSNEAGRRINRRVFVTIVHVFVFRS